MAAPGSTWAAAFAAAWPPTMTWPAAIRSAAWARDLASPRRTSSASRRTLLGIGSGSPTPARSGIPRLRAPRMRAPRLRAPRLRAGPQAGEDLREPAVDALEDRRMLGHGQAGEPREGGERLVHARIAGRPGAVRACGIPVLLHPQASSSCLSALPGTLPSRAVRPAHDRRRGGPGADSRPGGHARTLGITARPRGTEWAWRWVTMATADECRRALESLTGRLSQLDEKTRQAHLRDRSLSCHVLDLGVTFTTRIGRDGAGPVAEAADGVAPAQVRFTARSDDVVALAADPGSFARAWLAGRVKVEGNVFDLLALRKLI